jgi:hypothetical protein
MLKTQEEKFWLLYGTNYNQDLFEFNVEDSLRIKTGSPDYSVVKFFLFIVFLSHAGCLGG